MLTNPRDLREYKEVDKIPMSMLQSIFSLHQKGEVYVGGRDAPLDHHFIIKVQVPMSQGNFPMLCYNKERNVQYLISDETELGAQLKSLILERCPRLPKGYFHSMVKDGVHYIKPCLLPKQNW
eukprot:TRINITY_DN12546_c0_g1_i3.p1 TRINITY_DN12546_c0_g1~~TRINITY_DN12546_c0_g1_i3.p1  ORF type:complete len:123 (+),score=32.51 TRINITY_DN12546_c0_g1_i3:47-415(+)